MPLVSNIGLFSWLLYGGARHSSCECQFEMDLVDRHKRFLVAALGPAWKENKSFNVRVVGSWLKLQEGETDEIARALEKANLIKTLPNGEAIFTSPGREIAEGLKAQG